MENREQTNQSDVLDKLKESLLISNPREFTLELYEENYVPHDDSHLMYVCQSIDRYESVSDQDSDYAAGVALLHGANIGKYITRLFHPSDYFMQSVISEIESVLGSAAASVINIEDNIERGRSFFGAVVGIGRMGCSMYKHFTDAVEQIEDKIVDDATKSQYVRIGLGIVLYAMHNVETKQTERERINDLNKMRLEVSDIVRGKTEINWDEMTDVWDQGKTK